MTEPDPRTTENHRRPREGHATDLGAAIARATQEVRRDIAQFLHDDLQQHLHAVQVRLTWMQESLARGDTDETVDHLRDVETRVDEAIELTRTVATGLNPPAPESASLSEILTILVRQMSQLHDLDVDVDVGELPDVDDPDLLVVIFEVARELLFNVAKHAGTNAATMKVESDDGVLVVEISDNGAGFDRGALVGGVDEQGLGLLRVQERLVPLGASLEIDEGEPSGTRARVRVPILRRSRRA